MMGQSEPVEYYENPIVTKSGEERIIAWHNSLLIKDDTGEITGTLSSGVDVTERKHAEKQRLELTLQAERVHLLEQLISNLSHDLKTPLSAINTSIYLLKKHTDHEKQAHHVGVLEEQVARLIRMVDDILTISRYDEELDLEFKMLQVNDLIQRMISSYTLSAKQKNLTVTTSLVVDLSSILADKSEVSRAIANLVENALQNTPAQGTITIRTYSQDNGVVIEIQDTGIGIGEADLPYIFEHFYRADTARRTTTGGLGLGLPIAKRIIAAHAGRITVESVLKQGSIFTIWLPTTPDASSDLSVR